MTFNQRQAITLALISGAFWGLPFVVPLMLAPLSPSVITIGRFLFFFLASLYGSLSTVRNARTLTILHWIKIFSLSALGFWFYTFLLFTALPHTGGVAASLIIGLLPITIPLYARDSLTQSKSFRVGLLVLTMGLAILTFEKLAIVQVPENSGIYYGLLVLALLSWTIYSVENSKFIKSTTQLSPEKISQLMGLLSFPCILLFMSQIVSQDELKTLLEKSNLVAFLLGSMALGFGSSFIANRLWNKASSRLPNSLMGPLMISETAAGLTYSFIFEHRLPTTYETLALTLFAFGVALCLKRKGDT